MHSTSATALHTIVINPTDNYPALVLLHGWGFDHHIWTPLLSKLTPYYQVWLVDLPGMGDSAVMTWPEFKTQLLQKVKRSFAVVGWSLGGLYAMRLALEVRSSVTHLICVSSSPFFMQDTSWPGLDPTVLDDFAQQLQQDFRTTQQQFLKWQFCRQLNADVLPRRTPAQSALQQGLIQLKQWDFRQELNALLTSSMGTVPTAFYFGRLDAIVPIKVCAAMQLQYPQCHYHVFQKAGHLPFLSHPEEFLSCLTRSTGV